MKPALLLAILLAYIPSEAAARPRLSAHIGVPYYFSFYGRSADPNDSSLDFAAHVGAEVAWHLWGPLRWGAAVDGGLVLGDISGVDGYLYSSTLTGLILLTSAPWTGESFQVGLGAKPGLLFSGVVADENLQKHSVSIGVITEVQMSVKITERLSLGLFTGLGLFSAPITEDAWFNQPLGRTNTAYIDAGVSWDF